MIELFIIRQKRVSYACSPSVAQIILFCKMWQSNSAIFEFWQRYTYSQVKNKWARTSSENKWIMHGSLWSLYHNFILKTYKYICFITKSNYICRKCSFTLAINERTKNVQIVTCHHCAPCLCIFIACLKYFNTNTLLNHNYQFSNVHFHLMKRFIFISFSYLFI